MNNFPIERFDDIVKLDLVVGNQLIVSNFRGYGVGSIGLGSGAPSFVFLY